MVLKFLNGSAGKGRSQMMVVDLGSRTTKALLIERRGDSLGLLRYALLDAPIFHKKISPELLSEHLTAVSEALGGTTKNVTLTVGLDDLVMRQVDMPPIAKEEMRSVIKTNAKTYLQQDYPNPVIDCHVFPARPSGNGGETGKAAPPSNKIKVLVAGVRDQFITDIQTAVKGAGLTAHSIVPGVICPVNAFEMSAPELYASESVMLVDIGFKQTSVCVVDRGELALNRTVNIGGDQLTAGLAEAMSISYAEAEGIKVGMAPEVQSMLELQISPLGRELRASLDFVEHQQDRPVSQVFVSGGSAQSEMILQMLHAEMFVDCKTWNGTKCLQLSLSESQAAEITHVASQLTVAAGAALTAF